MSKHSQIILGILSNNPTAMIITIKFNQSVAAFLRRKRLWKMFIEPYLKSIEHYKRITTTLWPKRMMLFHEYATSIESKIIEEMTNQIV